ncbi:uncharacterized protein [Apostichopus japonicus]|uniref:uncharacterized protein n=1 Tax=Stichopus japonicus TaxID=307972 RepID=UPI003AB67F8A
MQSEGKVQFMRSNLSFMQQGAVAFSPQARYLFCTGGYDGRVHLYSARNAALLQRYSIANSGFGRHTNAVRFTCDGMKILTTTASRLAVLDVETGSQVQTYDDCSCNGSTKTGLATDPFCWHSSVCVQVNGKGLTVIDLRMCLPVLLTNDLHSRTISDVAFLPRLWPWAPSETTLLTASSDGHSKVVTMDGKSLVDISAGSSLTSIAATPGPFNAMAMLGFSSVVMYGGPEVLGYIPEVGIQESLRDQGAASVSKIRYTSNGSTLYTACDKGIIRRYRRNPLKHVYLGEVYRHQDKISDMDISSYDEYLVTASDRTVGIMKLGSPSHGVTEYCELT